MSVTWRDGVILTVEAALSAATGSYGAWDAGSWGPNVETWLNANPTMEAGISGWTASGCAIAQSSTVAHEGTYSLRITPDGVASNAFAEADEVAVTAGTEYMAYGWIYTPGAWAAGAGISVNWYDASHGYLSTSSNNAATSAATWTLKQAVFTAPANAAYARIHPVIGGTPSATDLLYADEVKFGAGATTWGPDTIWTDISAYVRRISTSRKFSRDLQAWETGTATLVLDNRDGRFDPDNLSGPYVSAGVTSIRPLRPLRIRVTYAGVTYSLYTGYATDWVESWTGGAVGEGDAIVTVPCVDEMARLASVEGLEQSAVGDGESSGRRIHRLLDNAGHTGVRAIDDGRNSVQATTLAATTSTEVKLTADSEGGAFWIEPDGAATFEHQYSLIENSRSNTVQATFGDGGGSELPYADAATAYGGDLIVNIASYARDGGTAQTAYDATSRALYGDRRDTRTDLVCQSDAQAAALAAWKVARYKDPERRFTAIIIKSRRSPAALYPQAFGRRVRDLIRVIRRPPPAGRTITRDCFIAGISHDMIPDGITTRFDLWSASPYTAYATSRWDTAVWDTAQWFY